LILEYPAALPGLDGAESQLLSVLHFLAKMIMRSGSPNGFNGYNSKSAAVKKRVKGLKKKFR